MRYAELVPPSEKVAEIFGPYLGEKKLNLGCGHTALDGWTNVDRKNSSGVEFLVDLDSYPNLGMQDQYDTILASHVLEHIRNIVPLMRELHRILKPGGFLIAVTPYAASDDALEDPTHVRYFTERSWYYFDRKLYEREGHVGSYESDVDFRFAIVKVNLVPYPQFVDDPEIDFKKTHWRNVIREMQAVLRKE